MEELPHFKDILEQERKERAESATILESLKGFSKLSERQKQYILMSLYIQKRAERGTDTKSASRILEMPEKFERNAPKKAYIKHPEDIPTDTNQSDKYFKSQVHIMVENCHYTVEELEKYAHSKERHFVWNDAGPITSYEDLTHLIVLAEEQCGPPFFIGIGSTTESGGVALRRVHSTVLLGQYNNEYMVWEKSGFGMPYQLEKLSQVYAAYGTCRSWRIRPLAI